MANCVPDVAYAGRRFHNMRHIVARNPVVGLQVFRFIRNLTIVEWLVIAVVAFILGTFAIDEIRAQIAERNAAQDAQRDIEAGKFAFQIGGRQRPWFDNTAQIFKTRYNADLIRTYGCCPSCAEWRYTSRYNDLMNSALSQRIDGFSFGDAFDASDTEARSQWQAELAAQ